MTAGYPYGYQQTEGSTARTCTREVMEVDVLAFTAGNGGVKRKREEEEVGGKDSLSTRAKTVEGPAYTPSVSATALTPGWIEAQAQPAKPSSGERS